MKECLAENITAVIERNYKAYGLTVNRERGLPLLNDGLKVASRRMLYSLFLVAKKRVKSSKVIGHCLGNFHPHGDQIYNPTLVNLVQAGLVQGQGNWGRTVGASDDKPAAMRYTECQLLPETVDLAFSLIDQVPMVTAESDASMVEPVFLPVKIPLCFTAYKSGPAFGTKGVYPPYRIQDLVKRLEWLLGKRKTEPIIRPVYEAGLEYMDKDSAFKELLTTGKAKLTYRPKILVSEKSVVILARPAGTKSLDGVVFKYLDALLKESKVSTFDDSKSDTGTYFQIAIHGRGIDPIKMKKDLDKLLTSSEHYNCLFVTDTGAVKRCSIDELLLSIYKQYQELWYCYVDQEVQKLQDKLNDLELIFLMRPHLKKYLVAEKPKTDVIVQAIAAAMKADPAEIQRVMSRYSIKTLLTCDEEDKADLLKKQKAMKANRTEAVVWQQYAAIKCTF